jgi:hypothetical protein
MPSSLSARPSSRESFETKPFERAFHNAEKTARLRKIPALILWIYLWTSLWIKKDEPARVLGLPNGVKK